MLTHDLISLGRRTAKIQTGKTRNIPIILVHKPFWQGLLDWFKNTLVEEGTIDAKDLDLLLLIDEPEEIVQAIFDHYEDRDFEPSEEEQEVLSHL